MTHSIPPEGDEYNARRQEELHAAVANKATLTRRLFEMARDNAPADQMGAIIDVIASLDREIPHISKDLAVSVQGRNLNIFMSRLDEALGSVLADVAVRLDEILASSETGVGIAREALVVSRSNSARLVKVEKDVTFLKKGQTASNVQIKKFIADIADLRAQVNALGVVAKETNRLADEHNRLSAEQAQLAKDVADLKAWRAQEEARRLAAQSHGDA